MAKQSSKLTLSDLRLVVDYVRAIRNEIAVDERTFALAGVTSGQFGKLPRPSRWITKARRYPWLTRLLQHVSLPIWFVVCPIIFSYQKRQLDRRRTGARFHRFGYDGQVLALSARTADIVHARHIQPLPQQWLELPWLPLTNLPPGAEVIAALDLLDKGDLKRCLTLAIFAHRLVQRRPKMHCWGLQTYTAWRWFFARLAVDKLPGPLLMVDHFDRRAVMVDGSVWATRLSNPKRQLTLMQHGSIGAEGEKCSLNINLPTRLRGVNRLHVYSPGDEEIFRKEILSSGCNARGVQVTYFRSLVFLTEVAQCDRPSVLFVGHPLCESAHKLLIVALQAALEVQAFYKPHPTTGAGRAVGALPWTVIEGRTVFPDVDVIISYPSTMVGEYAAHGIPAVVHPMEISPTEVQQLIPEILRNIELRRSRKTLLAPISLGFVSHNEQKSS